MKRTLIILAVLAVFAAGCTKDKSKSLDYTDSNPIEMVFQAGSHQFDHQIQVSSDYDITYTAINNSGSVITVSSDGVLHDINVGTAQVNLNNGHNDLTVDVKVSLFRQPTYEFGCNTSRIRQLYGNPYISQYLPGDTILVYRYANRTPLGWYSAACFVMDFYFEDGEYFESDVYIRKDYHNPLLENYLTENFDYRYTIPNYSYDTIHNDSVPAIIYRNKIDTTIYCGKLEHANTYDDICLFYRRQQKN